MKLWFKQSAKCTCTTFCVHMNMYIYVFMYNIYVYDVIVGTEASEKGGEVVRVCGKNDDETVSPSYS